MSTTIPDEVFDFFASNPMGPILSVAREAADRTSPIHYQLNAFLSMIPASCVTKASQDPSFRAFNKGGPDIGRSAQIYIAEKWLSEEIPRQRLNILREDITKDRPRPYQISALADVEVDSDNLVHLSEFEFDGSRLLRNGYAFLLLPTTPLPHSTYWLLRAIHNEGLAECTRIRLDPFLFGPEGEFPAMVYKMWMYGCPLDWDRLTSLRQPEHGRWQEPSQVQTEFTDFAWTPRGSEIHFVCEEVPSSGTVQTRASRYLHAVYSPRTGQINHFDGAIRLFTPSEIDSRYKTHVRKAGKLGIREKIFRSEGEIPREKLSLIAQTFFVWNRDVTQYFEQGARSE